MRPAARRTLIAGIGILALSAGGLAAIGIGALKKGTPPVPEQAIKEAKMTSAAIKS